MKRVTIGALGAAAALGLLTLGPAAAQPAPQAPSAPQKVYRIALLSYIPGQASMDRTRAAMQRYGYFEGQNVVYMMRNGVRNGDPNSGAKEVLKQDVKDIVAWKPDLIVSYNSNAGGGLLENKDTANIPVVMWGSDVMSSGFAQSYKRPGGNMTGMTGGSGGYLVSLAFFKKVIPNFRHIGFMYNDTYSIAPGALTELKEAAELLGLELHVYNTSTREEFGPTVRKMKADGMQMLQVGPHEIFNVFGEEIGRAALEAGLPATGQGSVIRGGGVMAVAGGGMQWQAAYAQMHEILQGRAKPADIPFARDFSHSLRIHKAHADQLGLRIPAEIWDEAQLIDAPGAPAQAAAPAQGAAAADS